MKVKEFLKTQEDDIDVMDNVTAELYIAYCPGYILTEAGKEHFKDLLDYDIEIITNKKYPYAVIDVNGDEGVWQKKLALAQEFFYSIAGYCSCTDFDNWFVDEDE